MYDAADWGMSPNNTGVTPRTCGDLSEGSRSGTRDVSVGSPPLTVPPASAATPLRKSNARTKFFYSVFGLENGEASPRAGSSILFTAFSAPRNSPSVSSLPRHAPDSIFQPARIPPALSSCLYLCVSYISNPPLLQSRSKLLSFPPSMCSAGRFAPGPEHVHPLISERSMDEPRPLKVIYIGAGVSGTCAAI